MPDLFSPAHAMRCVHCGKPFSRTIEGRGRPYTTCSIACATARTKLQRADWDRRRRKTTLTNGAEPHERT